MCRYTFRQFILKIHSITCVSLAHKVLKSHEHWGFGVLNVFENTCSEELYISTHMFHDHLPHLGCMCFLQGTLDVFDTVFVGGLEGDSFFVMAFFERNFAIELLRGFYPFS